jgi:hypothetical protein
MKYYLKNAIQMPGKFVAAGTPGIEHGDYIVFPYEGRKYNDGGGNQGWLGNSYMHHKTDIDNYPDWFIQIDDHDEFKEPQVIQINIDPMTGMCVLGCIQLASRHPGYKGPSRKIAIHFARELQKRVAFYHPEHENLLELGWNPANDL